jgi:GNAT superfamily N-acetyltransferase
VTLRWVDRESELAPTARELFSEYQAELGLDLGFQGFQEELAGLPGKYGPPGGALLLVEENGFPAACGAIRDLGEGICEIKRLFVRPAFRRRGLARQISVALIERAQELGYERVRLDTLRRLEGAFDLYLSLGFTEIPPYNFNPEPDIVYLERELGN